MLSLSRRHHRVRGRPDRLQWCCRDHGVCGNDGDPGTDACHSHHGTKHYITNDARHGHQYAGANQAGHTGANEHTRPNHPGRGPVFRRGRREPCIWDSVGGPQRPVYTPHLPGRTDYHPVLLLPAPTPLWRRHRVCHCRGPVLRQVPAGACLDPEHTGANEHTSPNHPGRGPVFRRGRRKPCIWHSVGGPRRPVYTPRLPGRADYHPVL